jgi:hypothetical protein
MQIYMAEGGPCIFDATAVTNGHAACLCLLSYYGCPCMHYDELVGRWAMEDVGEREDRGETEACLAFIRLSDGAMAHGRPSDKKRMAAPHPLAPSSVGGRWHCDTHFLFSLAPGNRRKVE